MNKLLFLLIISCLFSCTKSNEEIVASHEWKACGGDYPVFGDWISGKEMRISGDAIYFKQSVATILDVRYRYDHYQLEVVSLLNGKRGVYCEKGKVN